ncbi:MAG: FxsA family protein [Pseudomonadales bacterium]
MGFWLLIFFLTPIVEMYLLIEIGGYIGALPTIALVMLTAVIGVLLLRVQGLATLTRGIGRLQAGQVPIQEMTEGMLLALAGALLLTPGFVTDTCGFLLLLPPMRLLAARWLLSRVRVSAVHRGEPDQGTTIIEGEWRSTDETATARSGQLPDQGRADAPSDRAPPASGDGGEDRPRS